MEDLLHLNLVNKYTLQLMSIIIHISRFLVSFSDIRKTRCMVCFCIHINENYAIDYHFHLDVQISSFFRNFIQYGKGGLEKKWMKTFYMLFPWSGYSKWKISRRYGGFFTLLCVVWPIISLEMWLCSTSWLMFFFSSLFLSSWLIVNLVIML